MKMLEIRYVFCCFRALVPSISDHVGRKIGHFGRMMRHVGTSWVILGQHGGMRGPHGIIMAHLGSSLGLWGEKVAVARARLVFSNATIAGECGTVEIWGVQGVLPLIWGENSL